MYFLDVSVHECQDNDLSLRWALFEGTQPVLTKPLNHFWHTVFNIKNWRIETSATFLLISRLDQMASKLKGKSMGKIVHNRNYSPR